VALVRHRFGLRCILAPGWGQPLNEWILVAGSFYRMILVCNIGVRPVWGMGGCGQGRMLYYITSWLPERGPQVWRLAAAE